jgi:hypothetical protein
MADAVRVRAFVADLPDLSPEQLAHAYTWAKKKFERWGIQPRDGGYLLAALCSEEKSVRNWQSLMRTNMQHWKVDLPTTPQKGWLRALSTEEYESILSTPIENASSGDVEDIGDGDNSDVDAGATTNNGRDRTLPLTTAPKDDDANESGGKAIGRPIASVTTPLTPVKSLENLDRSMTITSSSLRLPENKLYNGGERFASLQNKRIQITVR